jgi:beta-phosphoglucomutase-like phosphatase (HAD superfamily)
VHHHTAPFERAFRTWRPDAVVFDCDGLLMNTEPCWTVAETAIFARRGLPFGPEQKALVIGRSVPDAGAAMATAFGEPQNAAALAEELYALVVEIVGETAEAMTGAHAIVELAARAVPVIGVPTLAHQELPADVVVSSLMDAGLTEWLEQPLSP